MATRFATRPGRPSINSSARHRARNDGVPLPANGYQRRHRNEEPEEEEAAATPFPMWKTIAVVVVVIGCFAAVYPKMFHPMLLYALGYAQEQKTTEEEIFPHPSMKHGPGGRQQNFPGPTSRQGPQPHPGARGSIPGMGPGMGQTGEGGGRGKSMWHWMLPFYTVGVILFLLYTLSKILWKPKNNRDRRRVNVQYNADRDRLETDEADVYDDEYDEDQDEDSANGVMSNQQLRGLQRRLQDTELTMHEILSQLEQLSTTADPNAAEQIKKVTMETLNNLGKLNADRIQPSRRSENGGFTSTDARGNRQDGGLRFDANERRYLNDLQKALSDFKSFTENYIEEHSTKHPQEKVDQGGETSGLMAEKNVKIGTDTEEKNVVAGEQEIATTKAMAAGSQGEPSEISGIDIMESDMVMSSDQLKMENGEGELINVENLEEKVDSGKGQMDAKNGAKSIEEAEDDTKTRNGSGEHEDESEKKPRKHLRQRKGKRHVRIEE